MEAGLDDPPSNCSFTVIHRNFSVMLIGKESSENKAVRMMKILLLLSVLANYGFEREPSVNSS